MASLLWVVFAVTLVMYLGYGIVLAYHWIRWAHDTTAVVLSITFYLAMGAVLFVLLAGSIAALSA